MATRRKLRLAVLELWHVHVEDHIRSAQASEDLIGVWDKDTVAAKTPPAKWDLFFWLL
jgi:hypothetical protein